MKQQDINFNLDLYENEINWLIESLEYYLEESEVPANNETYYMEIATLIDKLLKKTEKVPNVKPIRKML